MEQRRREILKKLREDEIAAMGEQSVAGFDHVILRERLRNIPPL